MKSSMKSTTTKTRTSQQDQLSNQTSPNQNSTQKPTPIKANIAFEKTDLAELIALGEASSTSRSYADAFKKKQNKNSKKRTKILLGSRVAYTPRDIKIALLQLNPEIPSLNSADEILKVYIKKSLLWSTTMMVTLGLLEGLNILSQKFLSIGFSSYTVLGACAAMTLTGFTLANLREKNKIKLMNKYNAKLDAKNEVMLTEMINIVSEKFGITSSRIQITLQPLVQIEKHKKQAIIKIGLPLLHSLSNIELLSLVSYHFQYLSLCQQHRLGHLFNHTTRQPLKNQLDQNTSFINSVMNYPCDQLHYAVMEAATISAIEMTSLKSVISAYEKNHRLLLAYNNCLTLSKKGELIPINAITQIVCAAESTEIQHTTACAHIHDQVKVLIKYREDSLELAHQEAELGPEFSSQWLLSSGNQLANRLSMHMFRKFKFSEDQLEKTHAAHNAFHRLTDVDPVQQYYGGLFRMNRNITPNLSDGDAGSLLTLKTELSTINQQIEAAAPQIHEHLKDWDNHLTPHYTRQTGASVKSQDVEKLHLSLQEQEALLGKKSGLCLSIILSIANPLEQKVLYQILAGHRKCLNLQRATDNVVHCALAFQKTETSAQILTLRKSVLSLSNLCDALPKIEEMGVQNSNTSNSLHTFLLSLPRTNSALSASILPKVAIQLVQKLEEYRWLTELQLVETCRKVEDRLNIDPLQINHKE